LIKIKALELVALALVLLPVSAAVAADSPADAVSCSYVQQLCAGLYVYVSLIDLYVVESAAKLLKSQTHTEGREYWRNRDRTRERGR